MHVIIASLFAFITSFMQAEQNIGTLEYGGGAVVIEKNVRDMYNYFIRCFHVFCRLWLIERTAMSVVTGVVLP